MIGKLCSQCNSEGNILLSKHLHLPEMFRQKAERQQAGSFWLSTHSNAIEQERDQQKKIQLMRSKL